MPKGAELQIPLRGPQNEPIDLYRVFASYGVVDLPPGRVDEAARAYETTLSLPRRRPRTVVIRRGTPGHASVDVRGPGVSEAVFRTVAIEVRRILNLDENLAPFYDVANRDPELCWAARGAGRMLRTQTVFETVVKTICTTNCAWSGTVRMVTALVEHLGEPSAGNHGRAFPAPRAMAEADDAFYREVVRAGYRGQYLRALAASVAGGSLELEPLAASRSGMADEEVASQLLALPGVGPYAAAHIMMLLGRYSRLVLDSWTRPTYARLAGRDAVPDAEIEERFRPYGRYAGLAFWLVLTRHWVADEATSA